MCHPRLMNTKKLLLLQLPKIIQQIGLIIGLSFDTFVAMYIILAQWKIVCQNEKIKLK